MSTPETPLRIIHVIDKLSRHGAQTALTHLGKGLSQRNYVQRVYGLNDAVHPENVRALQACGAEVCIIGKLQLLTTVGFIRLAAEWLAWQPDIVFTMLFFSDIIGRTMAKICGVPVIVSSIRAKNSGNNRLQFFLDKFTAQWVDKVVFNTHTIIPFAIQHEGVRQEQAVHIPNGVRVPAVWHEPQCTRATLGIATDARVISTIGRLHPEKGYTCLLRAFQRVRQQIPNSLLLCVGNGASGGHLSGLAQQLGIAGHVKFLGERTDIGDILACCDVYVQSSIFEGMSNALMEALALGKPAVATGVGGTLELIEDGISGWFVKPDDDAMLAIRLIEVLQHPELARQVGAAAAIRMRTHFSLEKMVDSYDRLFRELLLNAH